MNISFIIPVYNGAMTLDRTLESIFLAVTTSDRCEVVIVDDGSSDHTPKICQQWREKYGNQVVYFRQENKGVAVSRNRGLQLSRGEWIWFVDCDDELTPDAVKIFHEITQSHDPPSVIIGSYKVFHEKGCQIQSVGCLSENMNERILDFLFRKNLRPTHGAIVVNRRLIGKMEYCEEMRQSEDTPVFVRLLLEDGVVTLDQCLLIAHRGASSLRCNADYVSKQISLLVDQVFENSNLPDELQTLKAKYTATRCVSASRIAWRAGQKEVARKCFWKAVGVYPICLGWLKSVRFLVRAYSPFASKSVSFLSL